MGRNVVEEIVVEKMYLYIYFLSTIVLLINVDSLQAESVGL